MILDNLLMFTGTSNGASGGVTLGPQTDRPTTGAQVSSNIIDLHITTPTSGIPSLATGVGARDIGIGDDPAMKLLIQVITAFGGGTSLIVALAGAPESATQNIPGTFVPWWTSPTYAEAQLIAGARLYDMDMPRPPANVVVPRYLQIQYTSSGTHTSGALEACIVLDRHDQMYQGLNNAILGGYPAGITVAN
jgi:hypothetical protein